MRRKLRIICLTKLSYNLSIIFPWIFRFHVTVSLHPYGETAKKSQQLTKIIPCIEDGMRDFRKSSTETSILLSKGGYRVGQIGTTNNDCFTCFESWKYWLNPFHWGKNIWTSTRIVMVIIILVISFCCLGTIVKLLTCFKWCCSCAS